MVVPRPFVSVSQRTNTTVSRPGQFRVALRIVVIPRGWFLPSRDRHSCRSSDGRTSGTSSNEGGSPDVAHAFSVPCRHSWRHSVDVNVGARMRPTSYRARRPSASSRFCAPFEGGCRGSINGSKRRLKKKKSGKCETRLNEASSAWLRSPAHRLPPSPAGSSAKRGGLVRQRGVYEDHPEHGLAQLAAGPNSAALAA